MTFLNTLTSGRTGTVLRYIAVALAGALGSIAFSVPAANWFLLVSLAVLFLVTVQPGSKKEGFLFGWLWGISRAAQHDAVGHGHCSFGGSARLLYRLCDWNHACAAGVAATQAHRPVAGAVVDI